MQQDTNGSLSLMGSQTDCTWSDIQSYWEQCSLVQRPPARAVMKEIRAVRTLRWNTTYMFRTFFLSRNFTKCDAYGVINALLLIILNWDITRENKVVKTKYFSKITFMFGAPKLYYTNHKQYNQAVAIPRPHPVLFCVFCYSSVGTAKCYGMNGQGSIPDRKRKCISPPQHCDQLCCPLRLQSNGYWD
jgi:hypothetical protein